MSDINENLDEQSRKKTRLVAFIPLIFLGLIGALFIWRLGFDDKGPSFIPSNLIGKKVEFKLEPMQGLFRDGAPVPTYSSETLSKGEVSLVNVWASWCISCRAEHRYLEGLAKSTGIPIYGLNYKDTASAGRRFLSRFGNPYKAVGMDRRGRVGIDFGVYGVPETFVIDGNGVIRYKIPGPVNQAIIEKQLLPAIKKARKPL